MSTAVMPADPAASPLKLWLPYALDIVAPFAAYALVTWLGGPAFWALAIGGLVAGAGTVINTILRKGVDGVGVLVMLELAASVVMLVAVHDPRLLLIRPAFYTALAAVYLTGSSLIGRPLSYDGAKPIATRGDPARLAAYEHAWATSPAFRATHRWVTLGFGLALAVDSALRVWIVYDAPVERSAWLSNVPHVAAMLLIVGASALAGRRFKRLLAGPSA